MAIQAAVNQDFITYAGDAPIPQFTAVDGSNVAVDISGATQITWTALRNLTSTAVVTKTKTGGQISFVNTGTDGKFQVTILATDTSGLTGWYVHYATITLPAGLLTSIVGRMNVGLAPNWTWDPGSVGKIDLYTVRDLIGDTIAADQQLSDQQVLASISAYSTVELAAAECCRKIAMFYARQVDTVEANLRTMYSARTKRYEEMSRQYKELGMARGGVTAYVGGISVSDKTTVAQNTDRVPPNFVIAMFDSLLPEAPVGHQTNANLGAVDVQDVVPQV